MLDVTWRNPCWLYAICSLGFIDFFEDIVCDNATQLACKQEQFVFPVDHAFAYPNVHFVYYANRSFDNIAPDLICSQVKWQYSCFCKSRSREQKY